jgi:predicted transposase YbfD/YdcC
LAPALVETWALDGKTLRGSKKQGAECFHLLAVFGHQCGMVVRQELVPVRGDQQPDEIAVVHALLERLFQEGGLEGRLWTMDALHTHENNAEIIVRGGGDYVMPVKENQETLYEEIRLLFDEADLLSQETREAMTITESWDAGHGRIEVRRLTASTARND